LIQLLRIHSARAKNGARRHADKPEPRLRITDAAGGIREVTMGTSSQFFVCAECGTGMERVQGVPVLQSLAAHAVHRCGACGHILLVQEKAGEWSLGWLTSFETGGAIACAAFV
jgi:DNA-directed RNA polymerase subunit RPC12/RpoP